MFATEADEHSEPVDVKANIERIAIEALRGDSEMNRKLKSQNGMKWWDVQKFLKDHLPEHLEDRHQFAYNLVRKAMDAAFGIEGEWESFRNPETSKTWIRVKK